MKYTCPNCGKHMEFSTEQLTESQYKVSCPQCGSALEIVGDYAYMPLEDGSLNLADDEAPEEALPKRDPLYDQAVEFVKLCNAITPIMLAARFNLTMEQAQQLMQQLENNGIVGPYNNGAPRKILIPHNTDLPYGLPIFNQAGTSEANSDETDSQGDPKFKSYTLNCSGPGCLLFILLVTLALTMFLK